ncbi:cytochrome c-type biogenesis protein [Parvularcula sp. IMCC14364]|uniref:cytochrome c-type biogenesis protein n=1 Tax=Parvularcula sp. IMCC14364 TaxID=3067902 RepID=UPI002740F747|nr:cytochrome c-type biogenesis protein [Parvularcula sp. IMCC14364]
MKRFLLIILLGAFWLSPALAIDPDEVLEDPALEERAREISKGLRCVVCKNQSIDESDAMLAKDLRILVRERVAAGDSNEEVTDYVVDRYGEFVLLRPRFSPKNLVLWISPIIMLMIGGGLAVYFLRLQKQPDIKVAPLSAEEQKELNRLNKDA